MSEAAGQRQRERQLPTSGIRAEFIDVDGLFVLAPFAVQSVLGVQCQRDTAFHVGF